MSDRADAVVVGAGLSGLVAARRLAAAGTNVVVIEAQARVGGRVSRFITPSGHAIEAGGEMVGPAMPAIFALAAELDVPVVPLASNGAVVRFHDGVRFQETFPFELAPESAEALQAATRMLDALAQEVPIAEPWNAPRARELDDETLLSWLQAHVDDSAARAAIETQFNFCGGSPAELSLLFSLWTIHAMGGWETWEQGESHRLLGGSSELVLRMAAQLGDRIVLQAPVRAVAHGHEGVTIITDRGTVEAQHAVLAISPQLCARIAWEPRLPPARDRLQDRYLQGHGIKFVALYDEPWWRHEGLAGFGLGQDPVWFVLDATGPDDAGARLVGFVPVTGETVARWSDALADPAVAKRLFLDQVRNYFGPGPAPEALHYFSWVGDPWSAGCAAGLGPGTLSTVGPALRAPVGPLVWAGAETGLPQNDWMEAAVSAGERAAREVLAATIPYPVTTAEDPGRVPARQVHDAGATGSELAADHH